MDALREKVEKIEKMVATLYEERENHANTLTAEKTMDVTGRVTIPKAFRTALGIENETAEVTMELSGDEIILKLKED
jgi:DNA-binding transcriptional regulator/RsmH inhibitor MraZ